MIIQKKIIILKRMREILLPLYQLQFKNIDANSYCGNLIPNTWESVKRMDSPEGAVCYCALGIGGEAGEVLDLVKKSINDFHSLWKGKDFKKELIEELKMELGDLLWYVSALINLYDLNLEEILTLNARKVLKANLKYLKRKIQNKTV